MPEEVSMAGKQMEEGQRQVPEEVSMVSRQRRRM